jgi:murein DD-endopeptidase MepM/ murein hydrolase activator NlpD
MYTYIRQINELFLDIKLGYADKLSQEDLGVRIAEARFLRAFAYQELVLRHGGVILRTREDAVDGPNEKAKARSSEEECWDFILKEYDKAAAVLPSSWTGANAGRATKGAALGMKARAAYKGEVTSCFMVGGTYAVIIQHGNYRTVYSNLSKLNVKQGDMVETKQTIGTIFTDPEQDQKTELYFQIYKDRNILNPELWIAK